MNLKMSEKIDLSIITIALSSDYVINCLKSIEPAIGGINCEIIVIDNASKDGLSEKIKELFPKVKIIRRETNGGYGENNNLGLKIAKGKYILLLNDDTKIIDRNIFKEMITWMNNHPKVAVSSSALANPDGKTYQRSGGYFPSLFKVFAWMFFIDDIPFLTNLVKPYHPSLDYFKTEHQQDWVTGAFYLVRKSALDQSGFFDEDFFLYVEEVELSYRLRDKGWQVWYLPKWKIVHFGMVSTGSENSIIMELQNLKLFYKKHYPTWQLPLLTIILKLGCLIRVPIFGKTYAKAFRSI